MSRRRDSRGDAPLLAWGEALRRTRERRIRLHRRLAICALGAAALLVSAAIPPTPRLVWNASASAPIGLYLVSSGTSIAPGDRVVARVPERFGRLAAERHYLPTGVPLVKPVAGTAGDQICARGEDVLLNGHRLAHRRRLDGRGRLMPLWSGCIRLRGQALFLLSADPNAFDGRYFGVSAGRDIIGRATLLWRR